MPRNAGNTAPATTSFRILSGYFISIPGQFAAAFLTAQCYISDHPSPHPSELTTSAILTLLAFLQLKYQWIHDSSQSPFSTHPIAMRVGVAASALHYLACAAELSFPLHRLAHHLIVSSGYAAVAALLSVFLPNSAALCVYAVFGLLSAAELLLWMRRKLIEEEEDEAEVWIRSWQILSFFNNSYGDFGDFLGQRIRRLPV